MPVGLVQLADLIPRLNAGDLDSTVSQIMKPVTVIPTLMPLPDALKLLVGNNDQFACVIDEYGGFAGVLTIEDIAMEIVGEITDEHDADIGQPVVAEEEGVWLMDGDVHLDEVERTLHVDLPRGEVETIAGMIIAELGSLPAEGETVHVTLPDDPSEVVADVPKRRRLEVDVLRVDRLVPAQVRVRLIEEEV